MSLHLLSVGIKLNKENVYLDYIYILTALKLRKLKLQQDVCIIDTHRFHYKVIA